MKHQEDLIKYIEQSIKQNWELNALTDYKKNTLRYKDVARKIAEIHLLFEESSIEQGDKIAICGKNSSYWAVVFLAVITYGAVAVPIHHEFSTDNIHNIVNHSEARLLYVEDSIRESLSERAMNQIEGIFSLNSFKLVSSKSEKLNNTYTLLHSLYCQKYPIDITPQNISYRKSEPDKLAMINYTSGTTGFSKGVMLPYRSLSSNVEDCFERHPLNPGDKTIARLPLGHVFGMVYDFLYIICTGAHIHFLTQAFSPLEITEAFQEIQPKIVCCVPLIIEKLFKKDILPKIESEISSLSPSLPIINEQSIASIQRKIRNAFGGAFVEIIIGGAPLNSGIETIMRIIKLPYVTGYGMTECGPIITCNHWKDQIHGSCGKVATNMEIKILSKNPEKIPGEVICRGTNLMLGYYKNEDATKEAIDADGWLHTGDMGTIDKEGNLTLKGRCKNMLLNASGQNIYPEEIELILNNMPYISESVIIMEEEELVALIYPDYEFAYANGLNDNDIEKAMETNRVSLNKQIPKYEQISKIRIQHHEFEKTAKKSIKRFLYQDKTA
jgi:long-chain acyl-CoA synthetase